MNSLRTRTWFPVAAGIIALASMFVATLAQSASEPGGVREISLDIDGDGKMDRALLVQRDDGEADLYIYLAQGEGAIDLSRQPSILKQGIVAGIVVTLASKGARSLSVSGGCGGCSNDYETTLTIVHRGGAFVVAGYAYRWETRRSAGECDINFLTGKGVISHGVSGRPAPIKRAFAPVRLADWSDKREPGVCKKASAM